ncbi:ATP-binding protein [Nonomuraea sp. NPDC050556]|uniref:sensor histidine kinase n=1 Tax=Nonomuraea sp. NPDC050556 TaxID=3364369 RepID=UPI0037B049BE
MPIRARLAVVAALAVALVVVAVTLATFLVVERELYREVDLSLVRAATRAQLEVKADGAPVERECAYLSSPGCAQLISRDGRVADSALPAVPEAARQVARGEHDARFVDGAYLGNPMRAYVAPVEGGGAIMVSMRADSAHRGEARVRTALLVLGGGGILAAAAIGYVVARTGLRPLTRLTAMAETIAATGDPSHRMREGGRDEVGRLSATFNTMLGALERSITAQRRLVADASHELRTPLTALRANIGLLGRDDLPAAYRAKLTAALRNQAAEMTGLVNDLIELARGEEETAEEEQVWLEALVADCVARARRNWPQVSFTVSLESVRITGVPSRLARAVNNLLDNAAKFGDGRVEVALRPGWELTVRDHGPGIAEQDLPHVFDRFYRSRQARTMQGSGLGLAIVQQVAHAHGASVSAVRAAGGGTLFRLAVQPRREEMAFSIRR